MSTTIDTFTEIIDITLYKYNSIDLKLWGIITRNYNARITAENSRLIKKEGMKSILQNHFKEDINRFLAVSDTSIHKEATSVYFIWQIFETMPNLKYIKVNLNKNSSYNRIIQVDQVKTIKYDIKVLRGFLRLFDLFNEHEVYLANRVLIKSGILNRNQHFKVIRISEFLKTLDLYLAENNTAENFAVTNVFIQALEQHESDNPEMLLITDKESDI